MHTAVKKGGKNFKGKKSHCSLHVMNAMNGRRLHLLLGVADVRTREPE